MSGLNIQNSRLQQKYSTVSGATPTIAPSTDHTDGTWTENDLYVGELYINVQDDTMFYRSLNGIIPITSGTTTINTTTFVNKTGDTMTGPLFTTTLSANTISATTVYSPSFNGTFIGDGSQLTGITSTTFTGGTVSGPVIFTSDVNLCGAAVTVSELSGCGGTIDVYSVINALDAISATTFYGDGSGLTNLPYFSGLTLDEVLTLGDTSISGNIVLSGGNITLGSGVFYGDGSGLTNIPSAPIPTLDDVLTTGNVSADNDILLTNGDIILGNGIFYGDGSGLTNLVATNDVFVTGGTYDNSTGTATFTNNTGDTFTVTGFTTGSTSFSGYTYITEDTVAGDLSFNSPSNITSDSLFIRNRVSGATYNNAIYTNTTKNSLYSTSDLGDNHYLTILNIEDDKITNYTRYIDDATSYQYIASEELSPIHKTTNIQSTVDDTETLYTQTASYIETRTTDGTDTSLIIVQPNNIWIEGTGTFQGAKYDGDYSANFVNRSLVDKEYVDNSISASTIWTAGTGVNSAVLVGTNGIASGDYAIAEGNETIASGDYSHAEGNNTTASGVHSHSEGIFTIASGQTSHAEGEQTIAGGYTSHSEGLLTTASGDHSHSQGFTTTASGENSHAEGSNTIASGYTSHAEGSNTIASGYISHAEGAFTTASGQNSHAEGEYTVASGYDSHAQGSYTTASGIGSHSSGSGTTASGDWSFVHGTGSTAYANGSIVLGYDLSGVSSNTVYVNNLNINSLEAGTSINNLGIDSSGNVIIGSTFSGYTYITEDTGIGSLTMSAPTSITSTVTDGTITNEDYNGLDYSRKSYDNGLYTSELILDPNGNWDQTMIGEKHTSGGTQGYIRFSQGGQAIDITTTDGVFANLGTQYNLSSSDIVTTATDGVDITTFTITPTHTTFSTTSGFGIEYDIDMSDSFGPRSLVDKEYVDNSISGFSTGYTYITEDTIAETLTLNPPTFSLLSGTGGAELRTADDYISPTVESYVNLSNSTAMMRAYDSSGEGSVSVNESVSTLASLSGSNQSSLQISHYNSLSSTDGSSNSMLVKDSTINKGLVYYDDYSTNFTNNSLISKKYVDNAISGFTTGYTYITEDTIAETLVFSGANSIVTTVTGIDNTDTLRVDGDEIRLTALGPAGQTNYLTVNRDIIANYTSLEDVSNNYAYETLSPTQKNINIYDDSSAQSTYTLSQTSELTRIEDGTGGLSECRITSNYAYLLNTSGEAKNNWLTVQPDYVGMKQDEGSSVSRLEVSNSNGFYQSQIESTGYGKGVSKTRFVVNQTTDDTPLSLIWPLSDLEIGTTAVGVKATVTGINVTEDKAYISELYAAVRMNAYAVTIFGGVDKLEKTEYTTATSTIDIDSLNAAIIVTGEVGETIRWSVKYELIYSVA